MGEASHSIQWLHPWSRPDQTARSSVRSASPVHRPHLLSSSTRKQPPAPSPKVCPATLFTWPSHRLQGLCPPNIWLLPLVRMGASATTLGLLDTVQRRACNSVTRYLTLTTSQFTPMHLHDSFLGLAFSSPCLRVNSSHLYAHFSSIYSCEVKKKLSYSQQLSADLLHW